MTDSDEARLTYWLDVLEEVVNGRPDGHACPFCGAEPLGVETKGGRVRVECTSCGEFFEGLLPIA
jgi:transcription elongation factor Elf1